jgi:hypothetical protein
MLRLDEVDTPHSYLASPSQDSELHDPERIKSSGAEPYPQLYGEAGHYGYHVLLFDAARDFDSQGEELKAESQVRPQDVGV